MSMYPHNYSRTKAKFSQRGFTLIEILVALFIFAIISLMLANSLRTVINAFQHTEQRESEFSDLRFALLMFSREVSHAVARPILDRNGKEEPAWIGDNHNVSLTHTGIASINAQRSSLERSEYFFANNGLWRRTYPVLDRAPETRPRERLLFAPVNEVRFEYWDESGRIYNQWKGGLNLPRGVNVTLTLKNGEKLSQFYFIPASNRLGADSSQGDAE